MHHRAEILLFLGLTVVSSCSSISKKECQTMNWESFAQRYTQTQGLDLRGLKQAAYRACSDHGIQPNGELLKKGHTKGIKLYCQSQKAWDLGLDGESYNLNICPSNERDELEKVHATAEILYKIEDFETKAQEARDRVNMLYQEISDLQKQKTELLKRSAAKDKILLVDSKISALQIEVEREKNQKDQALMRAAQLRRRIQVYKETVDPQ